MRSQEWSPDQTELMSLRKRQRPQKTLSLCHVRTQQEGSHLQPEEELSSETWMARALILDFLVLRNMKINFFYLKPNWSMLFGYGNLRNLRQSSNFNKFKTYILIF